MELLLLAHPFPVPFKEVSRDNVDASMSYGARKTKLSMKNAQEEAANRSPFIYWFIAPHLALLQFIFNKRMIKHCLAMELGGRRKKTSKDGESLLRSFISRRAFGRGEKTLHVLQQSHPMIVGTTIFPKLTRASYQSSRLHQHNSARLVIAMIQNYSKENWKKQFCCLCEGLMRCRCSAELLSFVQEVRLPKGIGIGEEAMRVKENSPRQVFSFS